MFEVSTGVFLLKSVNMQTLLSFKKLKALFIIKTGLYECCKNANTAVIQKI